ncbi:PIN domain-containing protein [Stackebrandtia soli]|uniref:PIN domain-containing protein n=1 Tax=Stackebrandtia soli TaxID=1892856 RepID=UPI0039E99623
MLYPAYLCDTLLSLAEECAYRPLWSVDILTELRRNLATRIPQEAADRRIAQMRRYFRDAEVTGYEPLISDMPNDPKDRHVLAAAICGGAEVIVTANGSDFKAKDLQPYHIEAVSPDDFLLDQLDLYLLDQLDLYPGRTLDALTRQAQRYRREPRTVLSLLGVLDRSGVSRFASEARRYL